ncbi:substrate-binding domain-containing protein [Lipingzhangella rawalii]|uniref:substrate-binding domain-containing protein n=1 Tax=Lipingzhangella rawalii TaxID=2055835 RepID=UPI0038994408
MSVTRTIPWRTAAAAAALALTATACDAATTDGPEGTQGDASIEEGFTVGLLLPESQTTRYEAHDRPNFEEAVAEVCPNCEVNYQNANEDTDQQQSQVDAMLTEGVDVIALGAVDAEGAGSMVNQAHEQGVPVVAYDRLAEGGADHYVSFQNERVGEVQAESLVEALEDEGTIDEGEVVVIHGSPTDPNVDALKAGADPVLEENVEIGASYDTPEWSPDEAQSQMEQSITQIGAEDIVGVYSGNDGMAGGIIAAWQGTGVDEIPPVTGQDAELSAVQRIVAGEQYMSVYKAIADQARVAAEVSIALATGEDIDEYDVAESTTVTDAEGNEVESTLLEPIALTEDNIEETVLADDFHSVEDICTDAYSDTDFCEEHADELE